jgi:hypothetical protein
LRDCHFRQQRTSRTGNLEGITLRLLQSALTRINVI